MNIISNELYILPYSRGPIVVEEGDTYEWLHDVGTRSGTTMTRGSTIKVVAATQWTPHDEIGPTGCNWLCDAVNGRSVWATLEHCIARRLLKKVD